MFRSPAMRFVVIILLTWLMLWPLSMASEVVEARKAYSRETVETVGQEWGGAQIVSGPQLVIPVEKTEIVTVTRRRIDPDSGLVVIDEKTGVERHEEVQEARVSRAAPVFLYPERFDVTVRTRTQFRSRGIFNVPVYRADLTASFAFRLELAGEVLGSGERLLWEEAALQIRVSGNRALRGAAELVEGDSALLLEPMDGVAGFAAATGDPRGRGTYALRLGLNGAERLFLTPVGRETQVNMQSDWPDPSFEGAFLPDEAEIGPDGFRATWRIPHLARSLAQVSREDSSSRVRSAFAFGLRYLEVNDFYQKAWRAARYGGLFVALCFLTVFLIERGTGRPVHAVQYVLMGLAQAVFVLLMVSYAEHVGFGPAYALAAAATVGLLTLYGLTGLKLGARAGLLGSVLSLVYGVLYLILQSADHALLAGATLAFLALALTMIVTRNETWAGPGADGPGPLQRAASALRRRPPAGGVAE